MTAHRLQSHRIQTLRFAAASALAAGLLATACPALARSHPHAPDDAVSAELAAGHVDQAITLAEAAVAANPHDATPRAALGRAYLRGGRFEAAAAMLADAQTLGDASGRTALNLALSLIATGKGRDAVAVLDAAHAQLTVPDYGLAIALAGDLPRSVAVLTDGLHAGDHSPLLRENLAYAYALDGRWSDARLIVSMDLPANKVDARITQWAATAQPEAYRARVAALIGAPANQDAGMPAALALNASSPASSAQMASASPVQGELPGVNQAPQNAAGAKLASTDAVPAMPAGVVMASAAPAPASEVFNPDSQAPMPVLGMQTPVTAAPAQPAPATNFAGAFPAPAAASAPAPHKAAHHKPDAQLAQHTADSAGKGAHVAPQAPALAESGSRKVQLGSFSSQQNAEHARQQFLAKDSKLSQHHLAISSVVVNGRTFWRLTASGFDGSSVAGVCSSVRKQGGACLGYAPSPEAAAPALALASAQPSTHHH